MAHFNAYRRIDNFVIGSTLDQASHNLEVTSLLYYPTPNKHIAGEYKVSIENRTAKISLLSKESGYLIQGTLSLHFKSLEGSTEVILFADLSFGKNKGRKYFEGILCRFDTISGNLIPSNNDFPTTHDLEINDTFHENDNDDYNFDDNDDDLTLQPAPITDSEPVEEKKR